MENELTPEEKMISKNLKRLIVGGCLVVGFFVLNPLVIIGAGERGVVFNNTTGIENRVLNEGIHFRMPFIQSVKTMSVRVQANEVVAQAASKDLQTVTAKIVLNWHLDDSQVHKAYQSVGDGKAIIERIIVPNVNEVVKAATAQKTAEELLTKRVDLKDAIDVGLTERLRSYNVIVDDVSIVDIDFSEQFNEAIERKVTAQQNADAEKNRLEQVKYQAEQRTVQAKAEAEAIKIQSEALKDSPGLAQLEAVKKWNGVLPQYMMGETVPFLNLK